MKPARRAALLWGVIGALSFLVLLQGYELLTDESVAVTIKAAVALLVGGGAAVTTWSLQSRSEKLERGF